MSNKTDWKELPHIKFEISYERVTPPENEGEKGTIEFSLNDFLNGNPECFTLGEEDGQLYYEPDNCYYSVDDFLTQMKREYEYKKYYEDEKWVIKVM